MKRLKQFKEMLGAIAEKAWGVTTYLKNGRPAVHVNGEDIDIGPGYIEVWIGSNMMSAPDRFNIEQAEDLVAALLVAIKHSKELQSPK